MKKLFIFLILLFITTSTLSILLGEYTISFEDLKAFYQWYVLGEPTQDIEKLSLIQSILVEIRLPRILAAILIGASYAVSGAALQSMFVNPLVSPGILGVLSGSAFGAALSIAFFDSIAFTQLFAFVFGLLAVLFAVFIAHIYTNKGNSTLVLILGGIISGSLFSTLLSIVKYTADPYNKLPSIVYWMMGSLASVKLDELLPYALVMISGIVILILLGKHINVLSFGDDQARSLGVNTKVLRLFVILLATLISALSVALGGMIGWIGLIIPHIGRLLVGPNNIVLMPTVALLGATFLIIIDDFARTLFEVEIPIGILTSLLGIPVFIFILKNSKKGLQ